MYIYTHVSTYARITNHVYVYVDAYAYAYVCIYIYICVGGGAPQL